MWILPLLGYVGVAVGFSFLTLAIASGLYYLSELVEEYTVLSKRLLTRLIQTIIVVHILLLLFDGFPIMLTIFSAASHGVYLANVSRTFPMVRLTDGVFILSCCLVLANHILWFRHFSHPTLPPDHPYSSSFSRSKQSPYDYSSVNDPRFSTRYPTFSEISAFFGLCVWLVPFSLFVSLSASENVLPSTSDIGVGVGAGDVGIGSGERKKKSQGMAKAFFGSVGEWLRGTGQALGVSGGGVRRGRFE